MDKLIIDNNWLTTVLSIAASAYIFLLGVPTIIFQTYLPEELREIYIKRKDTSKSLSSLKHLGWLLFFMIFVVSVGNILIPYVCQDIGKPKIKYSGNWNFGYIIFLVYYFVVVALLFLFSYMIYVYIMRQIKGGNVRKQIINAVMVEAMDYFKEHQQIKREDIQDFQVMGKSFSSGLKKKELLDELSSFTQFVIYSRTYNGVELQGLIKDVFQDSFCYNLDSSSKSNLSAILEICKDIILRSDDEISSVDRISLADLVDKIAHIAIEKNYETVFNQSFDLLKKLPDTDEKMFKICKKNYSIERYDLIQRKIINLSNSIRNTPIYSLNEHKIRHVLCYLSWFHSGLEHMKYFTDQRITELKVANILTSQVLTDAITYFQNKGDYKSAHSINELRKDYFSESEQRNK